MELDLIFIIIYYYFYKQSAPTELISILQKSG